jgi:hypothetical protein
MCCVMLGMSCKRCETMLKMLLYIGEGSQGNGMVDIAGAVRRAGITGDVEVAAVVSGDML